MSGGNDGTDGGDGGEGRNWRGIVAALVLLACLVGGGVWLAQALRGAARIQDCVAAGRSNCAPLQ